MLVVRNCFVAKPGQAGKLAGLFKEVAAAGEMPKTRILTDLTGEFNRVILEFEVTNLEEFEKEQQSYASRPVYRQRFAEYAELWTTGSREILRVA